MLFTGFTWCLIELIFEPTWIFSHIRYAIFKIWLTSHTYQCLFASLIDSLKREISIKQVIISPTISLHIMRCHIYLYVCLHLFKLLTTLSNPGYDLICNLYHFLSEKIETMSDWNQFKFGQGLWLLFGYLQAHVSWSHGFLAMPFLEKKVLETQPKAGFPASLSFINHATLCVIEKMM